MHCVKVSIFLFLSLGKWHGDRRVILLSAPFMWFCWGNNSELGTLLPPSFTPRGSDRLATVGPVLPHMIRDGLPPAWNICTEPPFIWLPVCMFSPRLIGLSAAAGAAQMLRRQLAGAPQRGSVGTGFVCTPLIIDLQQNKSGPNWLAITDNIWRPLRLLCFSGLSVIWTTPLAALASPDSLISLSQSPR